MNKLAIVTLASSLLLFTGGIAGAQTARARIADTPIRAEANLASPIIATLKEGGPVDVVNVEGEWCRVLVPNEQSKPQVGYVLANLIEILDANGSPQSISTRPTRNSERPMAHGQQIPPTVAQLKREGDKATERVQPGTTADLSSFTRSVKSASARFFVGAGLEGTAIVTTPTGSGSTTESGAGLGFIIGYGFTPMWALYGNFSGANMSTIDGSNFGLGHFDVGVRAHFLSGPHVVVPFVQAGLSGRGEAQTFTNRTGQHDFAASGVGPSFGGGLNIHVRPALAISAGVTWSTGSFTNYTVDKQTVPGSSLSATSARVHVGIIWFPQTQAAKG